MAVSMGEQQLDAAVTKIDFQARGSLYVVQGDRPRLRMRGRTPTLGSVTANSSGETLRITETGPPFGVDFASGVREMAFYLELPNVEDIRHSGEGAMKVGPADGGPPVRRRRRPCRPRVLKRQGPRVHTQRRKPRGRRHRAP